MSAELTEVRSEDSFNISAVHSWLALRIPDLESKPTVRQFRSGASNLTFLLEYPGKELVLRCPPKGTKAVSAHDMVREFSIQKTLKPYFSLVPNVLALCQDISVIGSDFYVMERVNGLIPRRDVPSEISISQQSAQIIGQKIIEGLVELHSVNPTILESLSKGPGYVSRQIDGWSRRFRAALTDDVLNGENVMTWLDSNKPSDSASCIIHGDWRLDNIVMQVEPTPSLVGVLDWELATVGDPLMDLGSALAYWVDRDDDPTFSALRRQPSNLPGMPTRKEFVEKYLQLSGLPCSDFTFYEIFGLFRLAVIAQQIWARYKSGQTTNPSFAQFGSMVNILIDRATNQILEHK